MGGSSHSRLWHSHLANDSHFVDEFDYWHVRTLTKMGVLYEGKSYSAGLTATTPSLGIMGSGSVFTSVHDPVLTPNAPVSAANYQEGLDPNYSSKWAVGGGMSYRYKNTRTHFSIEWYQAVPRTVVLESEPFQEASTGTLLDNSAVLELDAVTNFGLGVEHKLNDTVQLYASYITNYSALPDQTDANMAVASWDIYQLTGGSNFTLRGIEFTLGLEYAFGRNLVERVRISDDGQGLVFEPGGQEVRYKRLEGFLGFTFLFGEDPNAKPSQTLGSADEG